jgi:hypothetical protein
MLGEISCMILDKIFGFRSLIGISLLFSHTPDLRSSSNLTVYVEGTAAIHQFTKPLYRFVGGGTIQINQGVSELNGDQLDLFRGSWLIDSGATLQLNHLETAQSMQWTQIILQKSGKIQFGPITIQTQSPIAAFQGANLHLIQNINPLGICLIPSTDKALIGQPIRMTLSLNEPILNVSLQNLQAVGGTLSHWSPIDLKTYTFLYTKSDPISGQVIFKPNVPLLYQNPLGGTAEITYDRFPIAVYFGAQQDALESATVTHCLEKIFKQLGPCGSNVLECAQNIHARIGGTSSVISNLQVILNQKLGGNSASNLAERIVEIQSRLGFGGPLAAQIQNLQAALGTSNGGDDLNLRSLQESMGDSSDYVDSMTPLRHVTIRGLMKAIQEIPVVNQPVVFSNLDPSQDSILMNLAKIFRNLGGSEQVLPQTLYNSIQ